MIEWQQVLKADPTAWLLEPEPSPVRYWTLVDILDRLADDLEVRTTQALIPAYQLVAELLTSQDVDGCWGRPDYSCPGPGVAPSGC